MNGNLRALVSRLTPVCRSATEAVTSNATSGTVSKLHADSETTPEPSALAEALGPEQRKISTPALFGRWIVAPYLAIRARNIDHILTGTLLPKISTEILSRMAEDAQMESIEVDIDPKAGFVYRFDRSLPAAAESGRS